MEVDEIDAMRVMEGATCTIYGDDLGLYRRRKAKSGPVEAVSSDVTRLASVASREQRSSMRR